LVFVNTSQHKSTLVNGYRQNAASARERAWIWVENGVMVLAGQVKGKSVLASQEMNYAEMSHIHGE